MKIKTFQSLFLMLLTFAAVAQPGKDGPKTVTLANQVFNEYTTLSSNAAAGATTITVAASGLNTNSRFSGTLAAGDLIMIIQMQGATIDGGSYWPNFGYVNNYGTCGANEFCMVASVPNSTTINLSCPLLKSYTAAGRVQVIRVPRLSTLTVNSGGSITCDAWNGTTGGVVAMEVDGATTINTGGLIHATAMGFRGGTNTDMNSATGSAIYASTDNNDGAEKGEGIAGAWADYDLIGGRYGRNAAANGGGGGNAHNGGGGGGGNGSRIWSYNGNGYPDTSTATWKAAWDLESANFHRNKSDGGGRGGYTYSWQNLDATLIAPGDASWGGDNRRIMGGQGGRPLDYNFGRLFMGGGGGAGDQGPSTNYGGVGGRGGGLIYLLTYGTVTGGGQITSNGSDGTDAQGTAPWNSHAGIDGAGGGGSGGTIVVNSIGATANTITITANGGDGGDQNKTKGTLATANGEAEGPGGGGSGGEIIISSGSPTRIANGGANGISYAQTAADCGVTEFPPNGATKGGFGCIVETITNFSFNVLNDSICKGEIAKLIAVFSGTRPAGTIVYWYDSPLGGTLLGSGDTLSLSGLTANVTVYAQTCPGLYRRSATVVVFTPVFSAGTDLYLCNGATANLNASGGNTYVWTPSAGLSNPNISNPLVSATSNTQYIVNITTINGCTGKDTAMVYANTVHPTLTHDTAICTGNSVTLIAGGGTAYHWNNGSSNSSISVAPTVNQSYTVTVTSGFCTDSAKVNVTVAGYPAVNLGHDTTFCNGPTLSLNAGNPGSTYHWQDNSVAQSYAVTATGTYSVTVTNPTGCASTDAISVSVLPNANATITPHLPACMNDPAFTLAAVQTGGVWTGTGITDGVAGIFNPAISGSGNHTITYTISGLCGDTDQTTIQVVAPPTVFLGNDTSFCTGPTLSLNAGNPGAGYHWQDNSTAQSFAVTTSGIYTVTVTNGAGCSSTDAINVNVLSYADATITPHLPVCFNDAAFTLTAAQAGGIWHGAGFADSISGLFNPALSGTGAQTVTYTIAGLCGDSDNTTIQVNAQPTVFLGNDTSFCSGAPLILNAGNPGSGYHWQDNSTSQNFTVASSGTYAVTVTNASGCTGMDAITVNILSYADATITPHPAVCESAAPFAITAAQAGGVWDGAGFSDSTSGIFDPGLSGSGTYTITYTIGGICGDSDQTTIQVNAAPTVFLGNDTSFCTGATLILSAGNSGAGYHWQDNSTLQTYNVTASGTYTVTVTNGTGCTSTDAISVSVLPFADATITPHAPICQNAVAFTLAAAQSGGVWDGAGIADSNTGVFNPNLSGSGTHTITYTIAGICGDVDQTTINVYAIPVATFSSGLESCMGSSDAWIALILSGGQIPYNIIWNNADTTQNLSMLAPGVYTVTVTDAHNCQIVSSEEITESTLDCYTPHVYVPNVFSPNGDGVNDVFYVRGAGVESLHLLMYDRWGEKVFETTDLNSGWNGTFRGADCESGVYVYTLRFTLSNGDEIKSKGSVTIVR